MTFQITFSFDEENRKESIRSLPSLHLESKRDDVGAMRIDKGKLEDEEQASHLARTFQMENDGWRAGPSDGHELQNCAKSSPSLDGNEWKTGGDDEQNRLGDSNTDDDDDANPFRDPTTRTTEDEDQKEAEAAVTEQPQSYVQTPVVDTGRENPDIHQKIHRRFICVRAGAHSILFFLAMFDHIFPAQATLTYRGMVLGTVLAFVVVEGVFAAIHHLAFTPIKETHSNAEQWRRIGKALLFDVLAVALWLLFLYAVSRQLQFPRITCSSYSQDHRTY
jgi:hypothetical protein